MTVTPKNHTAENNQVLKLVPPQGLPPGQLPQQPTEEISTPTPTPQKAPTSPWKKWAIIGTVALGIGGISLIPMPNFVTGDAEITSREDERQAITMPRSGRVEIKVKTRQPIAVGDIIAEVESDELNSQITQAEQSLEQTKVSLNAAQQDLFLAQSRLQAAETNERNARDRVNRKRDELTNITISPQAQQIQQEIAAMREEIQGVEVEILAIQADKGSLEAQLASVNRKLALYRPAAEGIPQTVLINTETELLTVQSAMTQKDAQVETKRRQIQQKQSLIAAKSEQINQVSKQLQDTVYSYQDDLTQAIAQTRTAQQEVQAATTKIQSQQQVIVKLNQDLAKLQQQKSKLQIKAETSGVVTTPDLDLKQNKHLNSGEEILDIVKLTDLEAEVKIHPEDRYLVKEGAQVSVELQGSSEPYTATVESIDPMARLSEQNQKPMLTVQILIENEAKEFLLQETGYAHIKTENLRVYQKVSHEFNKLVNIRKYFPWLTMNREPNS
ncbi:MAG: HlyD family efflux transporter periplasmic adaptor subunit [Spirulinaceae cyanobacterium]